MLVEPDRSAYDLQFRAFGFPVRVHPWFWLGSAIFGASALEKLGPLYLLIWIGVVFLSILIHELGHALAYRHFGVDSHIVLYAFGGLAVPWGAVSSRWRRVVVAISGPAAGFALFGLVYGSNYVQPWGGIEASLPMWWLYTSLFFVNLWWGVFNLLPVFPLDGGQVSQEVCTGIWHRNGRRIALQISLSTAVLMCVYSLACEIDARQGGGWLDFLPIQFRLGTFYTAILFGVLAYQSFQLLQRLRWV